MTLRKVTRRDRSAGVYVITHIPSGKLYVGSSVGMWSRRLKHLLDLKHQRHHSKHLQRCWDKYGSDQFSFEVLEDVLDAPTLIAREQVWIDLLEPAFNTCPAAGTLAGLPRTAEHRARISATLRDLYQDPERRALLGAQQRAGWESLSDDERRDRVKSSIKNLSLIGEEHHKKQGRSLKHTMATTDLKTRISDKTRRDWEDPVIREKQTKARQVTMGRPEVREKIAASCKAAWTPEMRAAAKERSRLLWADPIRRKKMMAQRAKNKDTICPRDL